MGEYKNPIPKLDKIVIGDAGDKRKEDINEYGQGRIVYFAFIDVLGFKKEFENGAEKFRKVFMYYSELMGSARFLHGNDSMACYAGQTSDSLYFYTEREDYLVEFIKIFSYFSAYAMTEDVFFRGGIAKGELFYKERYQYQFFGSSVINAYLMECEIARYPRIMVDTNTYEAIVGTGEGKKLVKPDIVEGRYYLKPFAYFENELELDIEDIELTKGTIDIEKVYQKILYNKGKFEYDARNYEKYAFLKKEYDKLKDEIL